MFYHNTYYVIEVNGSARPDFFFMDSYVEAMDYVAYPLEIHNDHYVVLVDGRCRLFVKIDGNDKIEYVGTCFDDIERHMKTRVIKKIQIKAERPETKAMWKVVKTDWEGNMKSICCLGDRDEALRVARDCKKENNSWHTYYTVERVEAVVP